MGCILSFFIKSEYENIDKPIFLASNKYCHKCNKDFLFNEYYQHIPECNRQFREKINNNNNNDMINIL
jgi:hypothetical protein